MNNLDIFVNFLVSLTATVVGILVVLWIERQRRPSLTISIGETGQLEDGDPLGRSPCTWLHIHVHNRNVPRWLAWVYRGEPALFCRAWAMFYHLDGHRVFGREMMLRWSETPEPRVEVVETEKGNVGRLRVDYETVDIPPGEYADLAVVIRPKSEEECYGWCNESYLHNWRHPMWRLEKQRYIVRIRVKTGGQEYSDAYLIANDVPYEHFRLEPLDKEAKKRLK